MGYHGCFHVDIWPLVTMATFFLTCYHGYHGHILVDLLPWLLYVFSDWLWVTGRQIGIGMSWCVSKMGNPVTSCIGWRKTGEIMMIYRPGSIKFQSYFFVTVTPPPHFMSQLPTTLYVTVQESTTTCSCPMCQTRRRSRTKCCTQRHGPP